MCIKSRVETLAHYRAGPTIDLNANCKMNFAGNLPFFCHNFTTTGPIEIRVGAKCSSKLALQL